MTAEGSAPAPLALRAAGVEKRYGGVRALRGLDIEVPGSTIHAVVGENGAGKSTLMNIIAGVVTPDSGLVEVDGRPFAPRSVSQARAAGIGIVHQELRLFPDRSVLANLFVSDLPTRRGLVDVRGMAERSREVRSQLGLTVDPLTTVGELSLSDRQLVELARVLLEQPRLLILDEPTSALNATETARLAAIIRGLPARGTTVLYVSHRLEEVFDLADDITVMRDGERVLSGPTAALTIPLVVKAIVGDEDFEAPSRAARTGSSAPATALQVSGLASRGQVRDVSFTAPAGEIVGVAGLIGSGADELLNLLFGAAPVRAGTATYPDGRGIPRSTADAARRGIALVPADRRHGGLMLDRTVSDNLALVTVGALGQGSFMLRPGRMRSAAAEVISRFGIKADHPDTVVGTLSGGNQQKVVVAKWLITGPGLILLDDPTRGVDIGAKGEIFSLVRTLADEGRTVLFRSTELAELVVLCDRILVLRDGRVAEVLSGVTEAELLQAVNTAGSEVPAAPHQT